MNRIWEEKMDSKTIKQKIAEFEELRTELGDLMSKYPEVFEKYLEIREQLDTMRAQIKENMKSIDLDWDKERSVRFNDEFSVRLKKKPQYTDVAIMTKYMSELVDSGVITKGPSASKVLNAIKKKDLPPEAAQFLLDLEFTKEADVPEL